VGELNSAVIFTLDKYCMIRFNALHT